MKNPGSKHLDAFEDLPSREFPDYGGMQAVYFMNGSECRDSTSHMLKDHLTGIRISLIWMTPAREPKQEI